MQPTRNVHLVLDMTGTFGRDVAGGVCRYVRAARDWHVVVHDEAELDPRSLDGLPCDGILGFLSTKAMADYLDAAAVPRVNVSNRLATLPGPSVLNDDAAIGRLAGGHFIERLFRHLAFYGPTEQRYALERSTGLLEAVRQAKAEYHEFAAGAEGEAAGGSGGNIRPLADWLASLPRPVGVLGATDSLAREVLDACAAAGLRVPDDVAVLGVGNDEILCDLAPVPLSSVSVAGPRIGHAAAELLDALMAGKAAPTRPLRLAPGGVTARRSSDVLAVSDPEVSAAFRYIHEHACEGLKVPALLKAVPVERRLLDRRFVAATGRTVCQEIYRVRLEHARRLLAETSLPVPDVSRQSGFREPNRFSSLFRQLIGITPSDYRRQCCAR